MNTFQKIFIIFTFAVALCFAFLPLANLPFAEAVRTSSLAQEYLNSNNSEPQFTGVVKFLAPLAKEIVFILGTGFITVRILKFTRKNRKQA